MFLYEFWTTQTERFCRNNGDLHSLHYCYENASSIVNYRIDWIVLYKRD